MFNYECLKRQTYRFYNVIVLHNIIFYIIYIVIYYSITKYLYSAHTFCGIGLSSIHKLKLQDLFKKKTDGTYACTLLYS